MISRLYHPSHISSVAAVAANPDMLCLQNILDEWTGLPKISKREALRVVSLVGGQGKHLGCKCKKVLVRLRGVVAMLMA